MTKVTEQQLRAALPDQYAAWAALADAYNKARKESDKAGRSVARAGNQFQSVSAETRQKREACYLEVSRVVSAAALAHINAREALLNAYKQQQNQTVEVE